MAKAGGKVKVILTGDRELDRKLDALKGAKAKSLIRKAARKAMRPVHRAVIDAAPVKSGETRRAVKMRSVKRSRKRIGINVTVGEGFFSGDTFHAAFVELGTKNIDARNWIKNAAESKRSQAQEIFRREARNLIEDLAK